MNDPQKICLRHRAGVFRTNALELYPRCRRAKCGEDSSTLALDRYGPRGSYLQGKQGDVSEPIERELLDQCTHHTLRSGMAA
jgi:hypothetical protein